MSTHLLLGIGAGLVAALLFSVVISGSPTGVLLLYLAPLPVLIVALGWHHLLGLLALAAGGLAISLVLWPSAGVAFAMGPALPAWWLAYLTLLARPLAPDRDASRVVPSPPGTAWFPPGALLLSVGLSGAFVALTSSVAIGGFDHAVYQDRLGRLVNAFLRLQTGSGRAGTVPPIAGIPAESLARTLVALAPAGLGGLLALVFAVNLWASGKVVAISGRLVRPWPRLPSTRMPPVALGLLGLGFVLSQAPGFLGVAGAATVGGLSLTFAVQGFAFLHDISRGRTGRGPLLAFTYLFALLLGQVVLPLLALAGMADTATALRRRLIARAGPPPPPPT